MDWKSTSDAHHMLLIIIAEADRLNYPHEGIPLTLSIRILIPMDSVGTCGTFLAREAMQPYNQFPGQLGEFY